MKSYLLRQQLFMLEPGKDAYAAPIPKDAPGYMLPTDDEIVATGNPTAVQLGFIAAQDGTITCNSERLYELFETNTLLRISVGDSFWLFWLSGEPTLISSVFTDVSVDKWYTDPVVWALQSDITNGATRTTFAPGQECTQAQILTFLYRAARGEGAASAEDMSLAVEWAKEKGIIDGAFDGSKPCTRATAVSYIWQAFDRPSAAPASFTDVDANADCAGAVSWAVEQKITEGDGSSDTFAPDKVCTRGHIMTFLYRAYNS